MVLQIEGFVDGSGLPGGDLAVGLSGLVKFLSIDDSGGKVHVLEADCEGEHFGSCVVVGYMVLRFGLHTLIVNISP